MKKKTLQELISISNGDPISVPHRFIRKAADGEDKQEEEPKAVEIPSTEVPVIDLGLLPLSDHPPFASSEAASELQSLHSALTSWGCFQAVNHGMTGSFLDEVREVAKEFFALPSEEKRRYLRADNDIEGYGSDTVISDDQVLDWNDRLYLSVYPEDRWRPEYWPQKPEKFSRVLHELTSNLKKVFDIIFKAMALSLNLDGNAFLEMLGGKEVTMFARFNFYPRCPRPELVYGLKPHADGSAITIVLPDKEVEGLQFLKDGQWVKVPIIPDGLIVNVGDQVEIMSNGEFKSPIHRAMSNAEHERISLAMFCAPDPEAEIEPSTELVDESRPALYKKVKNYPEIFFHHFRRGKRAIDAVKL